MKTTLKKLLCLLLTAVMLLPAAGLLPLKAEAGAPYKAGDIIKFGGYPQTQVTNSSLLSALNAKGKTADWISYNYMCKDPETGEDHTPGDWMKYCDVEYHGAKYRGVKFTQYRPRQTNCVPTANESYQDENGYFAGNTYWFKWEPLEWRVLDPNSGLVLCESIIDTQNYGFGGADWKDSTLRAWLDDFFAGYAFNADELEQIAETELNNDTSVDSNKPATTDEVYLLSYADYGTAPYGLVGEAALAKATDYAKCQGIFVNTTSGGFSTWWLRTTYAKNYLYADAVSSVAAETHSSDYKPDSAAGVRPAFNFKNGITESVNANGHEHVWSEWQQIDGNLRQHMRVCTLCEAHREYADHEWGDYTYISRPSCSGWGWGACECTVCGFSKVETIPPDPNNHVKKYEVITPATCKTTGTSKVICALCKQDLGTETTPIDPDAHVWDAGKELPQSKTKYTCTLCGATKTVSTYQKGDTIQFGAYPQTKVTNNSTISTLNGKASSATWYSYGYYSGLNDNYGSMSSGDFMKYCDVSYNGIKYRGVKMTAYRPNKTTKAATAENSGIDELGYELNTTYWFKWEPLTWRVLGRPDTGTRASLIICDQIIDAQAYTNTIYYNSQGSSYAGYYFADSAFKNYAADYSVSSIRHWLINDFYNTAFTTAEREMIRFTDVQSDFYAGAGVGSTHVNTNNSDKVYLLSKEEARLSYLFADNSSRIAKGTDYAMMQGGLEVLPNSGGSTWALRGGNSGSSYMVWGNGEVNQQYAQIVKGVRPVLNFVDDIIVPSPNSAGGNGVYAQDAELTHIWDNGYTVTPATCSQEGEIAYTCIICGEPRTEPIPALNHNWNTWKYLDAQQHSRTCKNDPVNHIEYGDHVWNDGVETKPATTAEEGVTTYTCSVCKGKKTEPIPMLTSNITVENGKPSLNAAVKDTTVTIIADPAPAGMAFDKWEVVKGGVTLEDPTQATTTFVMGDADVEVKATYKDLSPSEHSITVINGTAGVSSAAKGATVTLTADPAPEGKVFQKWEVVKGGIILWDATKPRTTFVMGNADVEVKATYKDLPPSEHSVTVINGVATPASAAKGTKVTLTASPSPEDMVFDKWVVVKGGVTIKDVTDPITEFVMGDENVEIKATYKTAGPSGIKLGDVDFDGAITSADARLALRKAVDLETYAPGSREFIACDVDRDNAVTSADARKILRAAVDLEDPSTW